MSDFDVAVIGSGPGGYAAAVRCAQLGAKTALIEKDQPGGTCLNRGCIPTKVLLESAHLVNTLRAAQKFGIRDVSFRADFPEIMRRKDRIVGQLRGGLKAVFKSYGVEMISGAARFLGGRELEVAGNAGEPVGISAGKIIIATGSKSGEVAGLAPGRGGVMGTDEILALEKLPETIMIVGAGFVGLEFASIFSALGSKVTLVEALSQVLPGEDAEIAAVLHKALSVRGVEIRTGRHLSGPPSGHEKVLLAVGRKPDCSGLDVEKAGIAPENGRIPVDSRMRTRADGIFAVGDVTGGVLLAYKAAEEGVVAAENAFGEGAEVDYDAMPRCVYSLPEAAFVGLSQAEAAEKGLAVRIGRFPFAASGRALAMEEPGGLVKVVLDAKSSAILGVQIAGGKATELISAAALLLKLEATSAEAGRILFPHPTLSEAIHGAVMAADGKAVDLPKPR